MKLSTTSKLVKNNKRRAVDKLFFLFVHLKCWHITVQSLSACLYQLVMCSIPVREAVAIFDANTIGPRSYIRMYDKYQDILTGQSEKDKEEFLKSDASLEQFKVQLEKSKMCASIN